MGTLCFCSMEVSDGQTDLRGLTPGDEVTIDLDPDSAQKASSFAARVEWIEGSTARLVPAGQLTAELRARLRPGALAQLSFERDSLPIEMRGIAFSQRFGRGIEFVVTEGFRLTDRRTTDRLPVVAQVRASLMADDGRVVGTTSATATKNLSLDGVLVARQPRLGSGPRWTIELTLPSASAPVQCQAVLARETSSYLALRFVDLSDSDRRLLATALVTDAA